MPAAEFSTDSERDALCGFLDKQRDALIRKVAGVSEDDARRAATVSSLSLLSLLKHSAVWERRWFQIIFAGRNFPDEWPVAEEDRGAEFRLTGEDTVESGRSPPALTSARRARGPRWRTGTCAGSRCT
jgi:hypothetical protein